MNLSLEYLGDVIDTSIVLFSILAVVANLLVCMLVLNSKQLRTYVNGFVISLAASDILTSITLFVHLIYSGSKKTNFEKAMLKYLICLTTTSEIGNLCAVSFERYLAVVKPFHYKTRVRKYFIWIVTSVWMAAIFPSFLVFLRVANVRGSVLRMLFLVCVFIFVFVPFLFMIILYIRIYVELRRQNKRVKDLRQTQKQPTNLRRNKEAKIVKIFAVVALLYTVSWLPAITHESLKAIQHFHLPGQDTSLAIQLFVLGSIISSLANPFIYTFAKQDFRQQIRRIYRNIRYKIWSSSTNVNAFSVGTSSKGEQPCGTVKRFSHTSNTKKQEKINNCIDD